MQPFSQGLVCSEWSSWTPLIFGFFSFYKTPISPLVFGFSRTNTKAILQTLWQDWPILSYLLVLFCGIAVPFVAASLFFNRLKASPRGYQLFLLSIVSILLFAFFIRGSIGKFPLRQEDFAVSKVQLINASVPNGAAALYEATKAWRNFQIKGMNLLKRSLNSDIRILKRLKKILLLEHIRPHS